jgi:G3E family GTPase
MADPSPVAQTFLADESILPLVRLDGIVTVVDAEHVLHQLTRARDGGEVNESIQQIAFADRILFNKVDLVGEEELREVRRVVKGD